MKRSDVNRIIAEADAFIASFGYLLPPFAYWSPDEMKMRTSHDSALIRQNFLGWDITDYGQGRYDEMGLFLFTVRNGSAVNVKAGMGVLYAEKIMISKDNQLSPTHRHILKTEDIINRGGGALVLELTGSDPDGRLDASVPVQVLIDGTVQKMQGGSRVSLAPGQSVTLQPDTWHAFWGENGDVLIGEVSNVNDDRTDNIFRDPIGRFSQIDEDEAPVHLLVSDYEVML